MVVHVAVVEIYLFQNLINSIGLVAQLVEQGSFKPEVVGSSPTQPIFKTGEE